MTYEHIPEAKFRIGQIIDHKRFGYRGVIFDVDPVFDHDDEWYETMATSSPSKEQPWYHVLVDGENFITYVAEQNLKPAINTADPVEHPLLSEFFARAGRGRYAARISMN